MSSGCQREGAHKPEGETAHGFARTARTAPKAARQPVADPRLAQQALGNQGVLGRLQAKLTVNQPGDIYEQEADRVAEAVMSQTSSKPISAPAVTAAGPASLAQRKCTRCEEEESLSVQRKESSASQKATAPSMVEAVLNSPGRPLGQTTRNFMESRFGHDFSGVRVHTDQRAAESASAVNALAYTVGDDVVLGAGQYQPDSQSGKHLLAHELAHVVQQSSAPPLHSRQPQVPRMQTGAPLGVARQPKPVSKTADVVEQGPPEDKWKGTMVSEIIISLARKRVGFRVPQGMLLGTVDTDLAPGKYQIKRDPQKQQWIFVTQVKAGLRFTVDLSESNADPWTLAYPETIPLEVTAGSVEEPKTYGEMWSPEGKLKDPLWLYEGWPEEGKPKPVSGIDDFEYTEYNYSYRSVGGNLSKWIRVYYRDATVKDINLDTITEATPNLWAAKKDALKAMDDYNTIFIEQSFFAIFFILTIKTTAAEVPVGGGATRGYRAYARPKIGTPEAPVKTEPGETEPVTTEAVKTEPPLKTSGKITPGTAGNKAASAKALAEGDVAPGPPLTAEQQSISTSLQSEHPGLRPEVANDASKGAASVAGPGGRGADVPLLNGGGREVSVHQASTPFTADSVGSHLQQEAMQAGTTEIYLQINSTGATREGFLKMLPGIRNAYLELRGITVKIFGPDGKVWWSGVFGGPQ